MTRFSSPTTKAGSGVARNFKGGEEGIISTFFVKRIFSQQQLLGFNFDGGPIKLQMHSCRGNIVEINA